MVLMVLVVFLAMAACAGVTPAGDKIPRAKGYVEAYEPGKMIKLAMGLQVQEYTEQEFKVVTDTGQWVFDITLATELKGEIKPGIRVLIRYTALGSGAQGPKTGVSIEAL